MEAVRVGSILQRVRGKVVEAVFQFRHEPERLCREFKPPPGYLPFFDYPSGLRVG